MNNRNIEWEYLNWLSDKAGISDNTDPRYSYSMLLEQLNNKEFEWSVPNDDNRLENGLYLRIHFQREVGGPEVSGFCSLLEVLVALAAKMAFQMSKENDEPGYWFYILMDNAGLLQFTDAYYYHDYTTASQVDNILNTIIFRRYEYNGEGGLFPLKRPREDQRGVELWYQLSAYVLERSGMA